MTEVGTEFFLLDPKKFLWPTPAFHIKFCGPLAHHMKKFEAHSQFCPIFMPKGTYLILYLTCKI